MDKILFFDIDGTLGQHGVITESNLNALHLLKEKGYNPVNQIVGYIMSGDPTYITSHKSARSLIMKMERDELVEEMLKTYIKHFGWEE